MAEYLQAPPRRKALGLLADALTSGQEALNTVNLPYVGGLGGLLFGQAPQYLQDVSYGMPAFRGGNVATGGLGTFTPDTRMLDVATLPFVGAGAAKAGQVGAKTLGKEVARQVETGTGLIGSNVLDPRQYMFIGEKSKAWDTASNKVAKALEKEGLAPETIWSQTGNVKAPDGKWRQEISDAEAVTTFPKRNVMGTVMPMEKRLSNENLYQAYPELRKMDLELTPKNSPSAGSFNSNWVELNASEAGLPNTKSILLHELQHAIQQKENFAKGGSPKDFAKNIESQKLYSDANILSRLQLETNDIKQAVDSFKERFKREPMFGSESIALSGLSPDEILAKKYSILSPDENYRRLFGEAESRLTENRIPLTQEQRLQYYPYAQGQYGLDVPYNELIVKGLLD
jgi:hypothetical protein